MHEHEHIKPMNRLRYACDLPRRGKGRGLPSSFDGMYVGQVKCIDAFAKDSTLFPVT